VTVGRYGSGLVGRSVSVVELLLAVTSCSRRTLDGAQTISLNPLRGERVVVESSAAQFYEARVIGESTSRLRVQTVESGDMAYVELADIYRLPSTTRRLAPRTFAICNIDQARWVGCRILEASVNTANVTGIDTATHQLPWNQILTPTSLTEMNLKRLFDKAGERRDFEHEISRAGQPRTIPGWQPSLGKSVIAQYDGKWWASVIIGEQHGKLRVKSSETKHIVDVARDEVAPEPPYPTEISKKSRFALARPVSQGQAWIPVRLISVDALEATVEDLEHGRRTVPVRDLCPVDNP